MCFAGFSGKTFTLEGHHDRMDPSTIFAKEPKDAQQRRDKAELQQAISNIQIQQNAEARNLEDRRERNAQAAKRRGRRATMVTEGETPNTGGRKATLGGV